MKKTSILLTILLVAMLATAGLMPWGLPGEEMVPGADQTSNGSVVVAENRDYTSRIYTLKEGAVSEIYRESRLQEGQRSSIVRLSADNESVYFLRELEDTGEWILMKLEDGRARQECRCTFREPITVTGMVARDGMVWVTGIMENGAIAVHEYTGSEEMKLKLVTPLWWLRDVVWAEFDGADILAVTTFDEVCSMTPDGQITYLDELHSTEPEVSASGAAWILCKAHVLLAAALVWLALAVSALISGNASRKADRLAVRLTIVGGEVILLALAAAVAAVFFAVHRSAGLVQAVAAGKYVGIAAVVVWLMSLLLLWLVSGSVTASIVSMTRQMADVADGNMKPRELTPGRDELSRMNLALQELCMGLSIRDYEVNATIGSYKRFVPHSLTRMLDRATVAEVDLGDSRRIVGNVGLFTVGNRDEVRSVLGDQAFVDFINETFGVFHDCIQENNGSMISCTLRLSCMETMFPKDAADGVRASLDFLGRVGKKADTGVPVPQPMMILHKASFLFGVAGKRERLFPYLSSSELEFLESFGPKFHESGTRVVMTEEYMSSIKNAGFAVRYIGFVSDGDKNAYKLYEVLDVYPELERKLRIEYDQRFQEAINLFYHNDFFLARNLFSTLLRVCPDDGIVRWYLFACEHCFNHAGDAAVDYRLFGIEEA